MKKSTQIKTKPDESMTYEELYFLKAAITQVNK